VKIVFIILLGAFLLGNVQEIKSYISFDQVRKFAKKAQDDTTKRKWSDDEFVDGYMNGFQAGVEASILGNTEELLKIKGLK